uniref:Uncharacterized protein n=1 Tax=Lepeophtheirus salmonis TaxID=72036 RepID=A0A0K2TNM5_LEPSM
MGGFLVSRRRERESYISDPRHICGISPPSPTEMI